MRRIRSRLALIYRALGDEEQYNIHLRLAGQTDAALGLFCGACGDTFGLEPDSVEALPCAHILHARLVINSRIFILYPNPNPNRLSKVLFWKILLRASKSFIQI